MIIQFDWKIKKKINKICLIWFRINRKNSLKNIYISLTLVYPILSPYKLINSLTMKLWFFGKLKGVAKSKRVKATEKWAESAATVG